MPNRRNVKSCDGTTADSHERRKDFLGQAGSQHTADAARNPVTGSATTVLILMMYRHGLRVSEAIALQPRGRGSEAGTDLDSAPEERPVRRTSDRRR